MNINNNFCDFTQNNVENNISNNTTSPNNTSQSYLNYFYPPVSPSSSAFPLSSSSNLGTGSSNISKIYPKYSPRPCFSLPSPSNLANTVLDTQPDIKNELFSLVMKRNHDNFSRFIRSNYNNFSELINKTVDGWNIVHVIAAHGNSLIWHRISNAAEYKKAKKLLMELYNKKINGWNTAHIAAAYGNYDILHGIKTEKDNSLFSDLNNDGWSVFHIAAAYGYVDIIKYSSKEYSYYNYKIKYNIAIKLINRKDNNGWNVSLIAAAHGHVEIIEYIQSREDLKHLNQETVDGRNIFQIADANRHTKVTDYIKSTEGLFNLIPEVNDVYLNTIPQISNLISSSGKG